MSVAPITDEQIEELVAIEAASTQGPWVWSIQPFESAEALAKWHDEMIAFGPSRSINGCTCPSHPNAKDGSVWSVNTGNGPSSENNARFISAIKQAFPHIIARLKAGCSCP